MKSQTKQESRNNSKISLKGQGPLKVQQDVQGPTFGLSLKDFQIGKFLGRGKYGVCYLARHITEQYLCCLKILYKAYIIKERCEGQLRREIEIGQNILHPNISRQIGYFVDETRIVLITEYCPGGDLYQYLQKYGKFDEKITSKIIRDVAQALQYLHGKSIIHRDIKLENVLCQYKQCLLNNESPKPPTMNDFIYKLSDYGQSIHVQGIASKSVFQQTRRRTQCGTIDYITPQMLTNQQYNSSCDIWSLGVMTYELMVGQTPFYDDKIEITKQRIVRCVYDMPKSFSSYAQDFIRKCLQKDQERRPSIDDLLKHPFLNNFE